MAHQMWNRRCADNPFAVALKVEVSMLVPLILNGNDDALEKSIYLVSRGRFSFRRRMRLHRTGRREIYAGASLLDGDFVIRYLAL